MALNCAFDQIGFSERAGPDSDRGYIDSAVEEGKSGFASVKNKVVKDSVWGMVELDWRAMRLLDSPLVQRLRAIKQLGFSYLTYPSAEHSRFIHSLGMYCVVSRFLDAIARREDTELASVFRIFRLDQELNLKTDLLHAAILHDVGHLPFSHVTEKILEGYEDRFRCGTKTVADFMFDVEECLEKKLSLSECLSLAIVLAPRFERFYREYACPGPGDPDSVLRLAALIAGLPIREDFPGAADLISGTPIDADKIDYVIRDASACGIPVGIDVARLFLRSAFLTVSATELKKLQPPGSNVGVEDQTIFVLNASGVDTIEELAQARAALYQRVYLHQTTRNAERLLGRSFEALIQCANTCLVDVLDLWAMDDFGLLRYLANHHDGTVRTLGIRLRNRQLPKRACVFGRSMVAPLMPLKDLFPKLSSPSYKQIFREVVGAGLELLRRGQLSAQCQANLETEIFAEAKVLVACVRAVACDLAPKEDSPTIVTILPMPNLEEERKDCIVLENNELVHSSSRTVSDEQTDAADIFKSLGYVLTSHAWRVPVFMATRTVLYRRTMPLRQLALAPYAAGEGPIFEVGCIGRVALKTQATIRRAGLDQQIVRSMQKAAEQGGYFDDKPHLASEPNDPRIEMIAGNLGDFCGQGDWRVTAQSCRAFIAQFPPRLRPDLLDLLTHFTVLDRSTIAASLLATVRSISIPGSGKRFICALSPDSGQFVRMILEQELTKTLRDEGWEFAKSAADALRKASPGDSLFLCDDNATSGSQAECQFMAWFGIPRDQWLEDQKRERGISDVELDDRDKELAKRLNIAVVVCAGSEKAKQRLTQRAKMLGIQSFLGVHYHQPIKPHSVELPMPLREFLTQVGADLFAWYRYGEESGISSLSDDKKKDCLKDALGYENAEGLLTTIFNVPVSTITALWCPGLFRGRAWMPLLLRRGYLEQLVIS